MKLAAVAFTQKGAELCAELCERLKPDECTGFAPDCYAQRLHPLGQSLGEWTRKAFETFDGIIFISACGIAVRAVAPCLKGKIYDPAVVVIDEDARFAISLLSGHIGGANRLAQRAAKATGAQPVISTATDCRGIFAVDSWAMQNSLYIANPKEVKTVSAALLNGEEVGWHSDFEVEGRFPAGVRESAGLKCGISVSFDLKKKPFQKTLHLVPQILYLGVGCRKGADCGQIEDAVKQALQNGGYPMQALAGAASIDLKKEEKGLLDFCLKYGIELRTFSAGELAGVEGRFSESNFVKSVAGVGCVCERAACALAGPSDLTVKKTVAGPVTVAVAKRNWRACFEY